MELLLLNYVSLFYVVLFYFVWKRWYRSLSVGGGYKAMKRLPSAERLWLRRQAVAKGAVSFGARVRELMSRPEARVDDGDAGPRDIVGGRCGCALRCRYVQEPRSSFCVYCRWYAEGEHTVCGCPCEGCNPESDKQAAKTSAASARGCSPTHLRGTAWH